MKRAKLLVATAAVMTFGQALADDEPRARPVLDFTAIDTNKDMYIDQTEFEAFVETIRQSTRAKFGGGRGGPGKRMFQSFDESDVDGDGMLNEEEFAGMKARFSERRGQREHRWRDDKS